MKAIIASLVVAVSLSSYAQDAPVDLLKKPVSFDGADIEISEVFEIVGMNLTPSPNVVFKGDAGEQKVQRLRVKDVSLGSLFKVIESVAEVNIEVIDEAVSVGGHDPFGGAPPSKRLTSSGIIVVSSKEPKKVVRGGFASVNVSSRPAPPKPSKVETEVISLAELKIPESALIDAIKITWDAADSNLKDRSSIAFHEPSKLLIISGPKDAIENAQKTVGALLPSYRELIQSKSRAQAAFYPINPKTNSAGGMRKNIPEIRGLFVEPEATEAPGSRRPSTPRKPQLVPVPVRPAPKGGQQPDDAFGGSSDSVPSLDLRAAPKPSLPRR